MGLLWFRFRRFMSCNASLASREGPAHYIVTDPLNPSIADNPIVIEFIKGNEVQHSLEIKAQLPLHLFWVDISFRFFILQLSHPVLAPANQVHSIPFAPEVHRPPRGQLVWDTEYLFLEEGRSVYYIRVLPPMFNIDGELHLADVVPMFDLCL